MKLGTKKTLGILLLIILILAFLYYLITHISDFKSLQITKPLNLIPLIIISFIVILSNGLIIKYLLGAFNLKLKIKEWLGLSIITTFYNLITPFRGGLIAKAAYLKKKYNFAITHFVSMMAGVYVINFLAASFLGLISLLLIYLKFNIFNILVFLIFLAIFLPSLFIILFSPKFPEPKNRILGKFMQVANGWNTIKNNKSIILISSLIIFLQIFLSVLATILSYNIFNINLNFSQALFLTCFGVLSGLVSITPAGLGVSEAIGVFSALVIGISPTQSLTVALLGRVIGTIIIFILGPIFSYLLLKNKNEPN